MERPKKLVRKSNLADLKVLEDSEVVHEKFVEDKALFVDKFPEMADPYAQDFKDAIEAADAIPDDEEVLDDIQEETQTVQEQMRLSRNLISSLLIYVRLAFKGDKAILELFGQKRLNAARNNQLKMVQALEVAHKKAENPKYKQPLRNKGFKQEDMDQLLALHDSLKQDNLDQESSTADRPVTTQARISALNLVWDYRVEISLAAKVVFPNDYAKQNQYQLYPSSAGGNDNAGSTGVQGSVNNSITNEPVPNASIKVMQNGNLIKTITADANGNFEDTELPAGTYQLTFEAVGYISLIADNVVINEGEMTTINGDMTPKLVTISISVTEEDTSNPAPNAEVELVTSEGSESFFTDASGNLNISFELEEDTDVTFNIIFAGYQNPSEIHTLSPGQTYNFNFSLTPEV